MQALWKGICPQKCLQESQEGKQKTNNKTKTTLLLLFTALPGLVLQLLLISGMDQFALACLETRASNLAKYIS